MVESMLPLVVATISLTIIIPAFNRLMARYRTTPYANDFIGALSLTRSEAVKRGERASVCASNADYSTRDIADWQQNLRRQGLVGS
ncbi:MAG: GspH/FimT family pseudopilin [Chromatiales bacterium]